MKDSPPPARRVRPQIGITILPAVVATLDQIAAADRRSRSSMVELLVEQEAARRAGKPTPLHQTTP